MSQGSPLPGAQVLEWGLKGGGVSDDGAGLLLAEDEGRGD